MIPPHEHVKRERVLRGLSVRQAAVLGEMSNTTWGNYEDTGQMTSKVRTGVALAFGWPTTWPESLPPLTQLVEGEPTNAELKAMLDQLMTSMESIHRAVQHMGDAVERLAGPTPTRASASDRQADPSARSTAPADR